MVDEYGAEEETEPPEEETASPEPEEPANYDAKGLTSHAREKLQACPSCQMNTLLYKPVEDTFECQNPECRVTGRSIWGLRNPKGSTPGGVSEQEGHRHGRSNADGDRNSEEYAGSREVTGATPDAALASPDRTTRQGRGGSRSEAAGRGTQRETMASSKGLSPYAFLPSSLKVVAERIWRTIPLRMRKFLLCCLALALAGGMAHSGYYLFTYQLPPIPGSAVFLVEGAVLVWLLVVLRRPRYRRTPPSLTMLFVALVVVLAVLAFAGLEPLSSYKDGLIDWFSERIE